MDNPAAKPDHPITPSPGPARDSYATPVLQPSVPETVHPNHHKILAIGAGFLVVIGTVIGFGLYILNSVKSAPRYNGIQYGRVASTHPCPAAEELGMGAPVFEALVTASGSTATDLCNKPALEPITRAHPDEAGQYTFIESLATLNAKGEDLLRKARLDSLEVNLRAYKERYGNYPGVEQLADDAWLAKNMPALDISATRMPDSETNAVVGTATPAEDEIGYSAIGKSGKACPEGPCESYTLYVRLSSDGTVYTKGSAEAGSSGAAAGEGN